MAKKTQYDLLVNFTHRAAESVDDTNTVIVSIRRNHGEGKHPLDYLATVSGKNRKEALLNALCAAGVYWVPGSHMCRRGMRDMTIGFQDPVNEREFGIGCTCPLP